MPVVLPANGMCNDGHQFEFGQDSQVKQVYTLRPASVSQGNQAKCVAVHASRHSLGQLRQEDHMFQA